MAPPAPDAVATPGRGLTSLQLRILSGVVLAPPVLFVVVWGSPAFEVLAVLAAGLMAREWSELSNDGRLGALGWAALAAAMIATAAAGLRGVADGLALALVLSLVLGLVARLAAAAHPAWLGAGVLVAAVPCCLLIWLRADAGDGGYWGRVTVLWLLAAVWATDIGAFVAGRTFGGPKLWPSVSPNKTWSGLAGGAAAAGTVGLAAGWLVEPIHPWFLGPFSAALAVVAQGGDLAESAVKRRFGVKDAGRLIPGHGGLLDRVDGLVAAVALVALCNWAAGRSVLLWG